MHKIISTENSAVGLTEKPTYIKIAANGSYVLCSETDLCKLTMTPCVWAPDTEGLWQWEEVNG